MSFGGSLRLVLFSWVCLSLVYLAACGGGGNGSSASTASPSIATSDAGSISGNWQFTMGAPPDNSYIGGIQSGFLLQDNGSITGNVMYMVGNPGAVQPCNSGAGAVTGSVVGRDVILQITAGGQAYALAGQVSSDGSSMSGTYSSTAGSGSQTGTVCGTAQSKLSWSAQLVPALTGSIHGVFHSTAQVQNQSIPVTGMLTQGSNIGSTTAGITGWLTFGGYPCLGSSHQTVSVNGSISGDSVLLQLFSDSGAKIGEIGEAPTLVQNSTTTPATFGSVAGSPYAIQGTGAYAIETTSCPADTGNVCLAVGDTNSVCTQPVTFYSTVTPPPGSTATDYVQPPLTEVSFPPELIGAPAVSQTIQLSNTDPAGSTLSGLSFTWAPYPQGGQTIFGGFSDFDGLANFTEQDTCASGGAWSGNFWQSQAFSLGPQQSCLITFSFSPQESCTWIPDPPSGVSPHQCPPFVGSSIPSPPALMGRLTLNSSKSVDSDDVFALPVTGLGLSAVVPSTPELDFGAQSVSEISPAQTLSFTNQGTQPVQILNATSSPCTGPHNVPEEAQSGILGGFAVVLPPSANSTPHSVAIFCDSDSISLLPNFQITSDACSGKMLAPQSSCNLQISYVPQPATTEGLGASGLDYFLELNTQQCTGTMQSNCEIDSGRFPVELKTNAPSQLRMSPGAGLDFGYVLRATYSTPLTIELSNDANDPQPGTVQLNRIVTSGDYQETDDCGASLAPGSSCTLTAVFSPTTTGFDPGSITISIVAPNYQTNTQTITLRGFGE